MVDEYLNKSGGSMRFYPLEECAATTPYNSFFIGVSAERVVAVVAEK